MSTIITNGNSIIINDKKIVINGEDFDNPFKGKSTSTSLVNGRIFVNGYEFNNGKFKRTIRSIWYSIF